MSDFDKTIAFIEQIQNARSSVAISAALTSIAQNYGLNAVCAGTLPGQGTSPGDQVSHLILSNWPAEWIDRYVSRNYIFHDPIVDHVRRCGNVILWRDILQNHRGSRKQAQLFKEARDFKFNDGIAMSFTTLEGREIVISFAGERVELSRADMKIMSFVAAYATGHALTVRGEDRIRELGSQERECVQLSARGRSTSEIAEMLCITEQEVCELTERARQKLGPGHLLYRRGDVPRLTPREKECLQWAAQGKSEWEVSQILGISEHTAEKHLLNAKTKLGAANRVHAVAEAIRCGIFD